MAGPLQQERPARTRRGRRRRPQPHPLLCPAASLLQWRHTLAGLLGRPPAQDEPVCVPLDGALHHLEALTRDGAAQAVKRAASAAGLVGNYASHSLRAGFVTDALDAGATPEQVQRHGRWTNVSSIDPTTEPLKIQDGEIRVPDKPGLGVEIDLEQLQARPRAVPEQSPRRA